MLSLCDSVHASHSGVEERQRHVRNQERVAPHRVTHRFEQGAERELLRADGVHVDLAAAPAPHELVRRGWQMLDTHTMIEGHFATLEEKNDSEHLCSN